MSTLPDSRPAPYWQPTPCPHWCVEPPGHPFAEVIPGDDVARDHYGRRNRLKLRDALEGTAHAATVTVRLTALEMAATNHGPATYATPVGILVTGLDGEEVAGPQARQVAAALLNAADEWDRAVAL